MLFFSRSLCAFSSKSIDASAVSSHVLGCFVRKSISLDAGFLVIYFFIFLTTLDYRAFINLDENAHNSKRKDNFNIFSPQVGVPAVICGDRKRNKNHSLQSIHKNLYIHILYMY